MKKRLQNYLSYMQDELSKEHTPEEWKKLKKDLLVQIGFFQHERLIHLVVTVLFALLTFGSIALVLITKEIMCIVLTVALLVLLIPYIKHYYLLENGTQKLYTYYDEIIKK